MTNYTKATNFAAKDSLASGNAAKVVKGTEIDTEFTNIETAVNSKSDSANPVFTGVAEFADGSASAPSITNTGDTNTGMFFPTADTIAFAEGGTETMRLDSSGNMGLGVTPSAWDTLRAFDIGSGGTLWGTAAQVGVGSNVYYGTGNFRYKATNVAAALQLDGNVFKFLTAASGTAGNAISFTQAMTLDASGNLGVGTSSPAKKLDIASGDIRLSSGYTVQWGGTNNYIYADSSSNFFTVITASSERMRIDSSGNVLVGKTSASNATNGAQLSSTYQTFTNTSDYVSIFNRRGTDGVSVYFQKAETNVGNISVTSSATAYNTSSDYRLKDNIAPMTGALAKISALKPVTYTWKADGSDGEGFIAHELAEVVPHAVTGDKDATEMQRYEISPAVPATFDEEGNELTPAVEAVMGEREVPVYQGIDTSFLVATLTAAIQEQQAIITQLQADVAALKAK